MMLVRLDQRFFINFFHMGAIFCFLPAILMSSTVFDEPKTFPMRYFFPCKFKFNFLKLSPIRVPQVGVSTNFVQEEPMDLPV